MYTHFPQIGRLETLDHYTLKLKLANGTGKLDKLSIVQKYHCAQDTELASLLVILENFGHHLSAIISGRFQSKFPNATSEEKQQIRTRIRTKLAHFAKQAFLFLYPSEVSPALWINKPWVCDGIRSEIALVECGTILLRDLPKYAYQFTSEPLSRMWEEVIEIVNFCLDATLNKQRIKTARNDLHIEIPEDWLGVVKQQIVPRDASYRIPTRFIQPSVAIRGILPLVAVDLSDEEEVQFFKDNDLVTLKTGVVVLDDHVLLMLSEPHKLTEKFHRSKHTILG